MTDRRPAAPRRLASAAEGEDAGAGAAWSPAPASSGGAVVAWAAALQALAAFVAHDLRNMLNAVAVNLEVVRARSGRGAEAAAIAPFAATAATQFERASAAAESLLALARPSRGPADVAAVAGHLARLVAVRGDGTLRLDAPEAGATATPVPPDVVRAVVARGVLSALSAGAPAACEITVGDGILLRVRGSADAPPVLDPDVAAVASAFAVAIATSGDALELRFPNAPPDATSDAPE